MKPPPKSMPVWGYLLVSVAVFALTLAFAVWFECKISG